MSLDLSNAAMFKLLDLTNDRVVEAAARGMEKAIQELSDDANKLAPKDKGKLRSSKKINLDTRNGLRITGTVSFSAVNRSKKGWNFNYALYLHEVADFDPTTPGTGPKFLERPLKAHYRRYQKIIADEIRKEFGHA